MSEAFRVQVCESCGHAVHPPRLLCPNCGAREFRAEEAAAGVVEEVTEVEAADGARIAAVRTELGPRVIARAAGGVGAGDRVRLSAPAGVATAARDESG